MIFCYFLFIKFANGSFKIGESFAGKACKGGLYAILLTSNLFSFAIKRFIIDYYFTSFGSLRKRCSS